MVSERILLSDATEKGSVKGTDVASVSHVKGVHPSFDTTSLVDVTIVVTVAVE